MVKLPGLISRNHTAAKPPRKKYSKRTARCWTHGRYHNAMRLNAFKTCVEIARLTLLTLADGRMGGQAERTELGPSRPLWLVCAPSIAFASRLNARIVVVGSSGSRCFCCCCCDGRKFSACRLTVTEPSGDRRLEREPRTS